VGLLIRLKADKPAAAGKYQETFKGISKNSFLL
jgi:hypothetical protein